ncbi:unnamed protein product [Brachionus calyciflorus]|uniref:Uncharacterized protein n=1 Tax=Brachionus calyciflorus TaxID=104777 RepID=A0A813UWW4_9BILA|nr:unnamed protein product [Brachionus calyciflorus]
MPSEYKKGSSVTFEDRIKAVMMSQQEKSFATGGKESKKANPNPLKTLYFFLGELFDYFFWLYHTGQEDESDEDSGDEDKSGEDESDEDILDDDENNLKQLNALDMDEMNWIISKTNRNGMKLLSKFKKDSKKVRVAPRFPFETFSRCTWNLYDRIITCQPRTTNAVEAWHNALRSDEKNHLKINELVEKLRVEQSNMECNLVKVKAGELFSRSAEQEKIDSRLLS